MQMRGCFSTLVALGNLFGEVAFIRDEKKDSDPVHLN